jgi:hypothetical protein
MGSVRVFLVAARTLIVLVAGVPVTPFWTGVMLTSQVPAFCRRMLHLAVRFSVFLLVALIVWVVLVAARSAAATPSQR